jgi:hypothetical protein
MFGMGGKQSEVIYLIDFEFASYEGQKKEI